VAFTPHSHAGWHGGVAAIGGGWGGCHGGAGLGDFSRLRLARLLRGYGYYGYAPVYAAPCTRSGVCRAGLTTAVYTRPVYTTAVYRTGTCCRRSGPREHGPGTREPMSPLGTAIYRPGLRSLQDRRHRPLLLPLPRRPKLPNLDPASPSGKRVRLTTDPSRTRLLTTPAPGRAEGAFRSASLPRGADLAFSRSVAASNAAEQMRRPSSD